MSFTSSYPYRYPHSSKLTLPLEAFSDYGQLEAMKFPKKVETPLLGSAVSFQMPDLSSSSRLHDSFYTREVQARIIPLLLSRETLVPQKALILNPISYVEKLCLSMKNLEKRGSLSKAAADFYKDEMEKICLQLPQLFNNGLVRKLREPICLSSNKIVDVEMDEEGDDSWLVVPRGKYGAVGTSGLATCIAFLACGEKKDGSKVLCIFHRSGIDSDMSGFLKEIYNDKLLKYHGCIKESVRFFAVGGQIKTDDPEDQTGSLSDQLQAIALSQQFPIKAFIFNRSKPGGSVTAIMTSKGPYFSVND